MSAQRAASLRLSFEQPGGLALRRPIGDQVKKNISVYAPRCKDQGVLTEDGSYYLESWAQAQWPLRPSGFRMGMRHAGSQQPGDDKKEDAEAGEMFFASDDEDCKTAGDHDAQGHVGGPVEIEDSDQDGQEDDEDSSVDAMDLPKWPNHMELGARGFISRALTDSSFSELVGDLKSLSSALQGLDRPSPAIKIGTICSGIGTQEMIGDIFAELWNNMDPDAPLKVEHTFLCENEGAKLKFLEEAFPSAVHIFTDMRDLHKGRARDYKDSNSYKNVPQVDGVISGFPCISVSPLNMYDLEFRDTTQATGCGWQSVRQFIRKFRPQWAILENVKSLAHCRKADNYHKPVDHICSVMRKLGYIPAYDVVNTLNFGLPQSRARCWMMFIRADCQHDQADLLGSFRSFMLQPCGLGKVLVGGHDPVGKFGGIAAVDRMIAAIKAKHLATCIPEREICILAVACVDLVQNHDIDPQAEAVISFEILCWKLVGASMCSFLQSA
ncbi:unnamed protein product [Cladocopium goreaui]|uniref:Type II methyltransferase M.NgoBV (M.NgoBV) (Cytosine-specific methyltransferase NgoV) (M.NgoV) (Modification methylase NgoBV) n=1 Tax=Cladocopium goreaui TaxID=2562237 RepID=A0A9P1CJM1_9DINO|nr:unnamed protein product [Cladocopium goreaui]